MLFSSSLARRRLRSAIRVELQRIETAPTTDPSVAVGKAKNLIEATPPKRCSPSSGNPPRSAFNMLHWCQRR